MSLQRLRSMFGLRQNGMKKKEADYLLKLPDNVLYPAARCAMDKNVCMYGASSSSGVESMNRANKNGV